MLTCKKVTSTESTLFQSLDALYATAFPWHEQREMHAKQQAIASPHYALEGWFEEELFVGLSGCWTFDDYVYVEHLAIDGALRSQGYGKIILGHILARSPMTILEIDPLTTDIAEKRLRFYESMRFFANPWPHTHPAYHPGVAAHALIVLSYPKPIDAVHYERFNADLCQRVMAL